MQRYNNIFKYARKKRNKCKKKATFDNCAIYRLQNGKKGGYWIDRTSLNMLVLDDKDFPDISSDDTDPVEVELIIRVKK